MFLELEDLQSTVTLENFSFHFDFPLADAKQIEVQRLKDPKNLKWTGKVSTPYPPATKNFAVKPHIT